MTDLSVRQERLKKCNLGFLRGPFDEEHPDPLYSFDETTEELRKFYGLTLVFDGPLANISRRYVDPLWHGHIIQTAKYRDFCDEVLDGEFLDHQSHTIETPVAPEALVNFPREYTKFYGHPPGSIWTDGIPPAYMIEITQGRVPPEMLKGFWSGWTGRRAIR